MNFMYGKNQYEGRLNRRNEVEVFTPRGHRGIIDEEKGQLVFDGGKSVPLSRKTIETAKAYKAELREELVDYYKRLLSGEERLLLIPVQDEADYPFVISSHILLDKGYKTEKFVEVLESVFYPTTMKKLGVSMKKPFQGMHDVHVRAGIALAPPKGPEVVEMTLAEFLKVVAA